MNFLFRCSSVGLSVKLLTHHLASRGTCLTVRQLSSILMCGAALALVSCANLRPKSAATAASYDTDCKNHAYVRLVLRDYISTRFHSQAPVRMAILPFSAPANVSAYNTERPGLGNELAWSLRSELVRTEASTIVEVLNRYDWPGKKDEFFLGNHDAINVAREAGYDLVLIGFLESMKSLDEAILHTKIIDVASGITVWNGRSRVERSESFWYRTNEWLDVDRRVPSANTMQPLFDSLVRCSVRGITSEEPIG